MSIKTILISAALAVTAVGGLSGAASAETRWATDHPRQHEVLSRDAAQRHQIVAERKQGELTRGRTARLLRTDHRIAREDHAFSRINGGYVTKGEQRLMNRQENRVERRIP